MAYKNIFDEPFDEGTLTKLALFEKYFEEWLPTFVMNNYSKPIQVFDFFAGRGYDKTGAEGSPIRILKVINKFRNDLINKRKKVYLFLNDINQVNINELAKNVENKIKELSLSPLINVSISQTSFQSCLDKYANELKYGCNLLFIDQNGFKEVSESVFQSLVRLETTDFLFFISSSFFHRFPDVPELQKHHPKFDFEKIKTCSRRVIHNIICEEYHKYVPGNITNYLLIPFSIMKDDKSNVYGLIFVCKHERAADKFLNVVWKQNSINGNANFDIDEDLQKNQGELFPEYKRLTKIESFQKRLREAILCGEITDNKGAYKFTLNQGHISKHADVLIKKMKKDEEISFEGSSPLVNYEKVIKEERIREYTLVKDETN